MRWFQTVSLLMLVGCAHGPDDGSLDVVALRAQGPAGLTSLLAQYDAAGAGDRARLQLRARPRRPLRASAVTQQNPTFGAATAWATRVGLRSGYGASPVSHVALSVWPGSGTWSGSKSCWALPSVVSTSLRDTGRCWTSPRHRVAGGGGRSDAVTG